MRPPPVGWELSAPRTLSRRGRGSTEHVRLEHGHVAGRIYHDDGFITRYDPPIPVVRWLLDRDDETAAVAAARDEVQP